MLLDYIITMSIETAISHTADGDRFSGHIPVALVRICLCGQWDQSPKRISLNPFNCALEIILLTTYTRLGYGNNVLVGLPALAYLTVELHPPTF